MGRISPDKGVEYMIKELAACNEQTKAKFKLLLAGRGDPGYISYLKDIANGFEIEFAGVLKPEVFYQYIKVLIVPSLWPEPFGRTVIEALSFEVPVCISNSGGLTELHDEISTWLYTPKETYLSILVEQIVNNQQSIEHKKTHCLASAKRFDQRQYVEGYQTIYNEIKNSYSV
jgi:glycosyltransferase involved in cell wall biosynthesis